MKKNLSILLSTVCLLGLTEAGKAQTNWNAYNDFYFDSTNYANHSPGSAIPFPTSPSDTGLAWGYYDANINGYGGYPTNIGAYFGPGIDTGAGQVLQAMAIYQPLGPGQGQIGGGVGTSADAWDATGGSGWARYGDDNGWGTSIGEYGGAWYAGAPGYGTPYASNPGLYLQPGFLGVPFSDGIANVVTWTAPSDGTYTFSGSFLIANSGGNAYAIVDSAGGVEVARTVGAPGTYNTFSFQKTLKAREIVEFQAGTDGQGAAPVGFNCNIQLVSITDWNAFNDFYFDSTNYITNSPGAFIPFPRSALGSVTSKTWGYYDANCNWYNGYPAAIGTYFGPGNNTAADEVLLALANYQPLGVGQGQVGGGVGTTADAWDSTPGDGNGFARYVDDNGWGTSLGEYGGAWFSAAPGYGTPYAANDGLWMQAGWLGGNNTEGEGICPVVTWTAPANGTYIFNGSFLIGNNGTSGPDGANCDYAIVDSLGGIEVPRTVVAQGSYNTFSFQKTFSAGDVVEFQVGSDYQTGAAVGFNCIISDTPVPAVLVSASRSLTNATQVSVQFNAPIYAPSADNAANFSINGVTVTSAELSPSDPTTVILSVSPGIYSASTLTVNGVENNFGQLPVAPNSTALITVPVSLPSGSGTPQEMAEKSQWVEQNLLTASNLPPFSFTYSGQASSVVLPSWTRTETDTVLDTNRTQHVITWTNNYVQVQCVAVEYNDYPLVEWTVYLKAIGPRATPILQSIQGLNTTMTRTNGPEFVLNGNQGDSASINSYEPYQTMLSPSTVNSFSPPSYSGKSCDTTGWPYYNVQTPGGGMILAIGWPGQWASSFTRDAGNDLQIQAGQQTTHLILNP
ncbi:MAG TPA: hypothetical protein VK811_09720, partial [Candidatus Acidoferrum sp.]|nr:hypothetical protein [Candidatus Acidoferrum sp.]